MKTNITTCPKCSRENTLHYYAGLWNCTGCDSVLDPQPVTCFEVPEDNFEALKGRFEKLNRRARKLNLPEIVMRVTGQHEVPIRVPDLSFNVDGAMMDSGRFRRIFEIVVEGKAPKVAGWTFIATIHPVTDEDGKIVGNEVRNVPGAPPVPAEYRNADLHCDHCQTIRRRNDVFIVQNESATKQVGRNCLADFLGGISPESYAAMAELLINAWDLAGASEDDGWGEGGSGRRRTERYSLDTVLKFAASLIRIDGWLSKAKAEAAYKPSTAAGVSSWLYDAKKYRDARLEARLEVPAVIEEDIKMATETEEWLEQVDATTENDYLYNLSLLGRAQIIEVRQIGLAVSSIASFLREKERAINRAKLADLHKNSKFIGEPKQRMELTLTMEFTREFDSDYGVSTLYKFSDAEGNVFVWWASNRLSVPDQPEVFGSPEHDIREGETVTVLASIKKHEEREGIKQTVITRCAFNRTKEQKKFWKQGEKAAGEVKKQEHIEWCKQNGYCTACDGSGRDYSFKQITTWVQEHRDEDPLKDRRDNCGYVKCSTCNGVGKAELVAEF